MSSISHLRKDKQRGLAKNNLKDVADLCNLLGVKLSEIGDHEAALQEHREELNLFEALNDSLGVAIAHRKIGEVFSELQKFSKALEHLRMYLSIAVEHNNLIEEQRAYATFGRTYFLQAEISNDEGNLKEHCHSLSESETNFLNALKICEKIGGKIEPSEMAQMRCRVYHNLGLVLDIKGETEDAIKFVSQSLELCENFDFIEDSYRSYSELAKMYQKLQKYDKALEKAQLSLKFASKMQKKTCIADSYQLLGQIYLTMDDFWTARKFFYKAYKSLNISNNQREIEKNLKIVIRLCNLREIINKPEVDNETHLKYFEKLADFFVNLRLYKQAIMFYENMLSLALKIHKEQSALAPIYISLAQTYKDIKQYGKALEYFHKELEIRIHLEDHREAASTLLEIAKISEVLEHNFDKISSYFDRALETVKKTNLLKLQGIIIKQYLSLPNIPADIEKSLEAQFKEIQSFDSEETEFDEEVENESEKEDIDLEYIDFSDSDEEEQIVTNSRSRRKLTGLNLKRNEKGETPLHVAVIKNNFSMVQNLLKNGHPVNERDFGGWLPIHEACNYGYRDVAEILLEYGAWVNDRGGSASSGTTPLHDAATNFHFDVVKLLVHYKANILARNDEGETPLGCLLKNNLENLSNEEIERLVTTMIFLKEKMEVVGFKSNEITTKVKKMRKKALNFVNNPLISDSVEEENDINTSQNEDLSSFCNLIQNNMKDSATDVYKTAMKSIGSHSRQLDNSLSTSSCMETSKPSLVPEDEYVIDDWLIDDLGQTKKRKKPSDKFEFEYRERSRNSSCKPPKRKPKHIKLTNFLERTPSNNEYHLNFQETEKNDIEIEDEFSQWNTDNHNCQGGTNKFSVMNTVPCKESSLCVQVKILQNKISIPVASTAQKNTISWLEGEVCKRYFQICGVKRSLKLLTLDDEELNRDDIIGNILKTHKPELKAMVTGSFEYSSLPELYNGVCQKLGLTSLSDVNTTLQECQSLGVLNLNRVYLRSENQFKPILSTIQFQNIYSLNFSSSRLEDTGMIGLIQSLPSFPLLEKLEAQSCSLTSESFNFLSNYLQQEKCSIKKLSHMNLSYNNFSQSSSLSFFNVLKFSLLFELKLISCSLSLKSCSESDSSNVSSLYIDYNSLSTKLLNEVMVLCPRLTFFSLQGCTFQNDCDNTLGSALSVLFGLGSYCMLKELNLSSCGVIDEDLDILSSYIYRCQSICKLNINNNNKLSSISLTKLIKELNGNLNVPLQTLKIHGIDSLENDGAFYACLSDLIEKKCSSAFPFVNLTLGHSFYAKNIKDLWQGIYKEKASVKILLNIVFLNVKN